MFWFAKLSKLLLANNQLLFISPPWIVFVFYPGILSTCWSNQLIWFLFEQSPPYLCSLSFFKLCWISYHIICILLVIFRHYLIAIIQSIKAELDTGLFSSSCLICPYEGVKNLCCHVQLLLHSASVLQYNNMNVAGVNPSVFFVSKNVVPFVNSKENYWTYMKKKSYFKLFFGFFCYIYFLVLESSL